MNTTSRAATLSALMLASLAGCSPSGVETSTEAPIETGRFEAVYSSEVDPGVWKDADAITADVDRKSETVVFTLADGSRKTLELASRPKEDWQWDCATMNDAVRCEVADLSPAPLELASLTFVTPVLYAKCGPGRLILAESPLGEGPFVAFNRVGE